MQLVQVKLENDYLRHEQKIPVVTLSFYLMLILSTEMENK